MIIFSYTLLADWRMNIIPKDMYIEGNNVTFVVKALSSDVRIKILGLLSGEDMNVQTIAKHLGISKTAVLTHINILEEAGFIKSTYLSGSVGNQRICKKMYDRLIFNFNPVSNCLDDINYYETETSVGNFFSFDTWAPCGLATSHNIIKKWDDPTVFCDPERINASLVWTAFGYIEYKIPLDPLFIDKQITGVEVEVEISAHKMLKTHKALTMPNYLNIDRITPDLTDVTVWINGHEILTHTITVGEDAEKATYTPSWWRSLPVHGQLLNVAINRRGCFLGNRMVSKKIFNDIIGDSKYLVLRYGIKPDALHINGFMLFGSNFGRYPHGIITKTYIE